MGIQWKSWLFRLRLVFVLIILVAIFSIISPAFLAPRNIYNVFWSVAVVGIMAVGANYVILVAGIDLSVGAVASISGILMANFMLSWNMGVLSAILVTLAVGALIGFLNGQIIIRFQLPDFIVTLVSMSIINGIAMALTGGETLGILKPPGFLFIGLGRLAGVPIPVYIFLFTMAIGYCILNFTVFGRRLFAVGGNKVASRLSGVSVTEVVTLAYTCSGITAAAAGVVLSSMTQQASSLMARGYELDVIAAIVIGGTSLFGGEGSIQGTLFGALLVGFVNNGLNLLNIPAPYHPIVKGFVIIIAVAFNNYSQKVVEVQLKKMTLASATES